MREMSTYMYLSMNKENFQNSDYYEEVHLQLVIISQSFGEV